MSNRRKPRRPWLTTMKPGERMGLAQRVLLKNSRINRPNRRRTQNIRRKNHIDSLIRDGKMK